MKFIADLHIHSRFSRATAKSLNFENLYIAARIKGITVVGTGDFTHPGWIAEILGKLVPAEPGLFKLKDDLEAACEKLLPFSDTAPVRFIGDENGRLVQLEGLKMELGEPDDSGRRRPVPIEGSEFLLDCDLAVVAIGANANPLLTQSDAEITLNKWGYIEADEVTGKTTKKGVWAGGDIVTGSATVILAMGAGRQAADSIHDYLTWGW